MLFGAETSRNLLFTVKRHSCLVRPVQIGFRDTKGRELWLASVAPTLWTGIRAAQYCRKPAAP